MEFPLSSPLFFFVRNVTDLSQEADPNDIGSILFDGNGFLKVLNPTSNGAVFTQTLSFKTLSPEGLVMFGRKGVSTDKTTQPKGMCFHYTLARIARKGKRRARGRARGGSWL